MPEECVKGTLSDLGSRSSTNGSTLHSFYRRFLIPIVPSPTVMWMLGRSGLKSPK